MARRKRVIWKEGMFLQPQHFQQEAHFFGHAMATQWLYQNPFFYGVAEAVVDSAALANGVFALTSCSGVFPDGTFFSFPEEDDAPASRSFAGHFSHDQQTCDVFLALPLSIEGRPSVARGDDEPAEHCRYRSRNSVFIDEVSGGQKKEIEVGTYRLSMLFSGESLDNYTSLRIARLRRNPNGQIELHEEFIPPLVQIGGSRYLMAMLRGLLEMLLAKSAALSQGRKEDATGKATFSSSGETSFRLLEPINTFTPVLNHYHFEPRVHPFELFRLLTHLAGALTSFSAEVSLKDLTRYEHENLAGTFEGLVRVIRTVLASDIEAGCVTVPIEQINQATYLCKLPNERLMASARFYLGVSAKVAEKELIVGVAQRIKMSSRDRLDLLISSAMPGLPLIHAGRPPEGLSTKPGFLYFAFDQQSQFWRGMQSAGSIAFYFPNSYPELKLEVLALKQ